ncbi:MAG: GHKL domain-containing protein [Clostridia bacterium]
MMHFVNDIMINFTVTDFIYAIAYVIENYLFLIMLLLVFDVKASNKQKLIYMVLIIPINVLSSNFMPSPFNVLVNYACMIIMLTLIFKLNILKSMTSLIITIFVFGLLNILIQNPYLTILDVSLDTFTNTPKYRIPYLIILYTVFFLIILFLKRFRKIKLSLDLLDSLDSKTVAILCINLIIGFLTLCIQLIITAYYIDIVPIIITILSFLLLVSFLILSIYSFTRIIKLSNAKRDLACAEEYNQSLEILYDKVKGYKHDFDNIVSALGGYIENDDMNGLKKYFNEIKKDCKITNNLSILNPRIISNPGIYSLLNNKYFKATNSGVTFEIEFFLNLDTLKVNMFKFSRAIGVLLDNAIEEAEKCNDKIVKISFIRENRNNRSVVTVKNTYSNKDVNLEKIFEKGTSNKKEHSGFGLWELRKYVKNSTNLDLYTSKDDTYFKQELSIYDL